jgi:hypothetical protein
MSSESWLQLLYLYKSRRVFLQFSRKISKFQPPLILLPATGDVPFFLSFPVHLDSVLCELELVP